MTLLLYAIADSAHPDPSDIPGLAGDRLRAVRRGDVAAIVGEAPAQISASLPQLEAFATATVALAGQGTILPARFGTQLADGAGVDAVLADQADSFVRRLAQVRDAVEFGLRVRTAGSAEPAPEDPSEGERAGTVYLMTRLATRRREEQFAAAITTAVGDLTRARAERPDPRNGLAVACLVPSGDVEPFLARVDALRSELEPAVEVTCTGPWPPFSFSAEEAA